MSALLLLVLGFGPWGARSSVALAGERALYDRAVSTVSDHYLDVEKLDADEALALAAEQAEAKVPWLIAATQGDAVLLRHGQRGPVGEVRLSPDARRPGTLGDLPGALERLEDLIRGAGAPIPAEIDLPVELLIGMARALDRHSQVLARDRLERFDERISGKLLGVGAKIGLDSGELVIKEVFEDSPGSVAGLKAGDRLTRIDGVSTVGMDVDSAVHRIRGEAGTELTLTIRRASGEGGTEEIELTMQRAEVVVPNLTWRLLPSGVGLITVDHFSQQTSNLMRRALNELSQGPAPLRGIIIDLREDEGGTMVQACKAADLFVESGVVLRTEGRGGGRVEGLVREYRAHPENIEPPVPVAVLQNRNSASASEILAGALALLDRAVLIGDRSHGKGTVQMLYSLRSGEAADRARFKLTVARYLLPGDVPIEAGVGLAPDLWVQSAIFTQGGAWLPLPPSGRTQAILSVDERAGWRDSSAQRNSADVTLQVAERVVLDTSGTHRVDGLAAIERVLPTLAAEQDRRLVETFKLRGIDWQAADEAVRSPAVDVEVTVVDPPIAGGRVEVRAVVTNRGEAPLHRVAVHLNAGDPDLPWSDVVLPVGFLPPGEQGLGSAMVSIDADLPDREDLVGLTLLADRAPPVSLDPVLLEIDAHPPPPVAFSARLIPEGDHHRVELILENLGGQPLTGLHARLSLDDDSRIELVTPEARASSLPARGTVNTSLAVRLPALSRGPSALMELRVYADGYGRILRSTMAVPTDGASLRVQPPTIEGTVPRSSVPGTVQVSFRATDESRVRSMTVWMDHDKLAWREGVGRKLSIDLPVQVGEGTRVILVEARDDKDNLSRRVFAIRGQVEGGTATP
jgi:carboxyl-terminal processing protease